MNMNRERMLFMPKKIAKILISGGGTGGHIFPAIAIADALNSLLNEPDILFVGAEGKMEMEKVPQAGYPIEGLPIRGLQRNLSARNLSFPLRLVKSLYKAGKIINRFKPEVVVGVGGYASGPILYMANNKGIPTLIQEQNSLAGLTNRRLAKKTNKFCVAYQGMEKFFPKNRIIITGNPIRKNISNLEAKGNEALQHFGLQSDRKTVLVIGGSQGALGINEGIEQALATFVENKVQLIWQTGLYYYPLAKELVDEKRNQQGIKAIKFIDRMDLAYSASNVIISRAGAIVISEISAAGKPCIFVPLPSAAEDHQTKNALALQKENAALMINNKETTEKLGKATLDLLLDEKRQQAMSDNISKFAHPDAATKIANEIIKLMQ